MKKLINFRPFVFMAISLSIGIFCAYLFIIQKIVLFVLLLCLFLFFLGLFFYLMIKAGKKKSGIIALIIMSVFLTEGLIVTLIKTEKFINADLGGHYFTVQGKVVEQTETDYGVFAIISNVQLKGIVNGKSRYKISVYANGRDNFDIGDTISFYSVLYDRSITYENRFSAENISDGIKYSAYVNNTDIAVIDNHKNIFEMARTFIEKSLKSGLEGDELGVSLALLIGNSDSIQEETLSSYRNAGVAHIFAVSGLHIGFIAFVIGFILKKLRIKRIPSFFIIVILCLFYSGICGFSASSIRATIMCAVMYMASIGGDRYDALSSVSFAQILVLLIAPLQLFCASFQLSFGVVYGIIIFANPIAKLFKFLPKKISFTLGTVLSAQLVALPISLKFFGSASLIAVIINLFFIPFVGVIFILLLITMIVGGIFNISNITLFIPKYILKAVNFSITAFDYHIFIISGIIFGVFSISYYGVGIVVSGIINLKVKLKSIIAVSLALITIIGSSVLSVNNYSTVKIYIRGSDKVSATLISCETDNILIINDFDSGFSSSQLSKLAEKSSKDSLDYVIILNSNTNFSLQAFISRITKTFTVSNAVYYGEKRETEETLLKKSFPLINCFSISDSENISSKKISFQLSLDGLMLQVKTAEKTIFVFGEIANRIINLNNVSADMVIAYDSVDYIKEKFSTKCFATCKASNKYQNGQTEGILRVKL